MTASYKAQGGEGQSLPQGSQRRRSRRKAPTSTRRPLTALCIVAWISAFICTHIPTSSIPRTGLGDEWMHVVGYFFLGGIVLLTLRAHGVRLGRRVALAMLVMTIYGGLDEITQPFFGRSASWTDLLADVAGTALACGVHAVLLRKRG